MLGATVGGASPGILEVLSRFSHFIGIGYQIKDDLADYLGHKGDIAVRKFSILLSVLEKHLNPQEKEVLMGAFRTDFFETIYEMIEKYQIVQLTKELLVNTINEAINCLGSLPNLGLKLALHEILGKVFKDYI